MRVLTELEVDVLHVGLGGGGLNTLARHGRASEAQAADEHVF